MIQDSNPGDTCLFVYNGHGASTPYNKQGQYDGTERQYLCCLGQNNDEYLWEEDLHEILGNAKPGVKIMLLIDACHAAYMAALPYAFRSTRLPTPGIGSGTDLQRFQARYNHWKHAARWEWTQSAPFYHTPQNRQVATAKQTQAKPFIICLSASEYHESSWNWGRMSGGERAHTEAQDLVWLFTVRMMSYMFGDNINNVTRHQHQYYNGTKPIGQQYYMTLDSCNLQRCGANLEPQHAVMTSNCKFDVDSFTGWNFFSRQFYQDRNGTYYLYEPSWFPWKWPWSAWYRGQHRVC